MKTLSCKTEMVYVNKRTERLSGLITAQHTIQSLFKSNFASVLEPFVDKSTVLVNPTVAWFDKICGSCCFGFLRTQNMPKTPKNWGDQSYCRIGGVLKFTSKILLKVLIMSLTDQKKIKKGIFYSFSGYTTFQ